MPSLIHLSNSRTERTVSSSDSSSWPTSPSTARLARSPQGPAPAALPLSPELAGFPQRRDTPVQASGALAATLPDPPRTGRWTPALVAELLPMLDGWPRGEEARPFELLDVASLRKIAGTPEMPGVDPIRVWFDGARYYSGQLLMATPRPALPPSWEGDEGFMEALAQELHACAAWVPPPGIGHGSMGMQLTGALTACLERAMNVAPSVVAPSVVAPEVVAPLAPDEPLDAESRRGLEILVARMREDGHWDSEAGDLAPPLVVRLACWPAGRGLEVCGEDARIHRFGHTEAGLLPVQVLREGQHYSAWAGGEAHEVPRDGNCFFHAVALAAGLGAHMAAPLRAAAADFMRTHPREIANWVDLPRIARTPSTTPATTDVPATHIPATHIPAAHVPIAPMSSPLTAPVALLHELRRELRALDESGRLPRPTREDLKERARSRGFMDDPSAWLTLRGHFTLEGHALMQLERHQRLGIAFKRPTPEMLTRLRAEANDPVSPKWLTTEVIAERALAEQVSVKHLRNLIDARGNLSPIGMSFVDRNARETSRKPPVKLQPWMLAELQALASQKQLNMKVLANRAREWNVRVSTLFNSITVSGQLSAGARRVMSGEMPRSDPLSPSKLQQVLAARRAREPMSRICERMGLSVPTVRRYVLDNDVLTVRGLNLLDRDKLPQWPDPARLSNAQIAAFCKANRVPQWDMGRFITPAKQFTQAAMLLGYRNNAPGSQAP